jgi:MFS-type transporter involved in bile tolerance (Atg22 family)
MQFSMCGIKSPSQWAAAQALFVVGTVSANVVNSFYAATFPSIVRDLPKIIESERAVKDGEKDPEEHSKLDSYERSKLYNLVNITGSALVAVAYAVAVGISEGIGFDTQRKLIYSYSVLMGYFGAITFMCTMPFFIIHKHRPGQQLPGGSGWLTAGPKQVWSAMKSAVHLKHCMLYLIAYFMLQESKPSLSKHTMVGN